MLTCVLLRILTFLFSHPSQYDDPGDVHLAAEVDHPDWFLDIEVVENGAAVRRMIGFAVDRTTRMPVDPLVLDVTLVLSATTVNERLLLEREILNCIIRKPIRVHENRNRLCVSCDIIPSNK